MKKILLYTALLFCALACKEDGEFEQVLFNYEVTTTDQTTLPEYGLNETANISFSIKSLYDFDKVPMNIRLISDKVGDFKLNDNSIEMNKDYVVSQNTGIIAYTGKELGNHSLKIVFTNEKKVKVIKEVKVSFIQHVFAVNVVGGEQDIYQGQDVQYTISITPEKPVEDQYKIMFVSYEEKDPKLEKSYVKLNGENITFNQWIELSDISNLKVILNSFYFGDKKLSYKIKNKTSERNFELYQKVKKRTIEIRDFSLSKTSTNRVDDIINFVGIVVKKPKINNKIRYKTWISSATNNQTDGIETTNNVYKDFELPNNEEFFIEIATKKTGVYTLNIQISDEFENETETLKFDISVNNKDFTVETSQSINTIGQGETIDINVKIKDDPNGVPSYKIRFLSFDNEDSELEKSKIFIKGQSLKLNTWYPLDSKEFIIKVNSWNYGQKNLKFEVTNEILTKEKNIALTYVKKEVQIEDVTLSSDEVILADLQTNKVYLSVFVKTNYEETELFYKTWLENRENENDINVTKNQYERYSLDSSNKIFVDLNPKKVGIYKINIQVKNKYGNEATISQKILYVDESIYKISGNNNIELKFKKTQERRLSIGCGRFETAVIERDVFKIIIEKINRDIVIDFGGGHRISKITYKFNYNRRQTIPYPEEFTENIDNSHRKVELKDIMTNVFCKYTPCDEEESYNSSRDYSVDLIFTTNKGYTFTKNYKFQFPKF